MKFSNDRLFASAIIFFQLFTGISGQSTNTDTNSSSQPPNRFGQPPDRSRTPPNRSGQSTDTSGGQPTDTSSGNINPVIGIQDGVQQRFRLDILASTLPDVYQITCLAESRRQLLPSSDDISYIRVSDIHGKGVPWGEPQSSTQDPSTGYCTHMTVVFLIWHRLYTVLHEQVLYNIAQEIANEYTNPTEKQRWQNAAMRVRLPYFDFAADDTQSRMPPEMTNELVLVTYPKDDGTSGQRRIANPYREYIFTEETRSEYGTTAQKTLRQPNSDLLESHFDRVNSQLASEHTTRKSSVYALFQIKSFRQFSTIATSTGGKPNTLVSLESIHNHIHIIFGGIYGDMSRTDRAAKDPAFWLLHGMIDRLFAMWECVWQNYKIGRSLSSGNFAHILGSSPNGLDDENTLLNPFRSNTAGDYYTYSIVAAMVKQRQHVCSIFMFGYSYDSVPFQFATDGPGMRSFVLSAVNSQYSPFPRNSQSTNPTTNTGSSPGSINKREAEIKRREWIVHLLFDASEVNGSASIELYFDNPGFNATLGGSAEISFEKNQSQDSIPKLIGAVSSFRKPMQTQENKRRMVMNGAVYISDVLLENGIPSLDPQDVVPFLEHNLTWMIKLVGVGLIPASQLPSLKVGVSSAEATYSLQPDMLPEYGQFYTHYDITKNKPNGFTIKDQDLVDSVPAPPIEKPSQWIEVNGTTTIVHVMRTIVVCPNPPPCFNMSSHSGAIPYYIRK